MPNSSQPYASLLPQFDPNILPDFSKFDISKIDLSQFSPSLQQSFNNLNQDYQNMLLTLGASSKPNSQLDIAAKNQIDYSKIAQQLVKKVAQKKAKDPNEVQLNTDVNQELEGTMPDKIEVPETDQFRDIINGAGSVNQSVGKYGDLAIQAGQVLGGMIGGQAGTAISRAATGTQTSINAIKNLKFLHKLEDGVPGLGTARAGNIASLAGAVTSVADSFLGPKSEYSGDKGNITEGLDSLYDGISDAAMSMGPIGMIVGGAMKVGDFIGDGLNKLGIGTDGMCVCSGTRVFTASGEVVNVENLKQEDGIIGWNEITKEIRPQTIPILLDPSEKECVEITLKSGQILRCSIDHPILSDTSPKAKSKCINGKRIAVRQWQFRRADELKEGDFVGLANNIDYWGSIEMQNAYLVGMLIGDGTYSQGNSCRLISADEDTWNYIESNNLGVINHCDDSRCEKYTKEVRTYRIVNGMQLMRDLGIVYQTGKNKTLPKNLGVYTKDSICKLIAGLFDTDGSISVNEEKDNFSITLYQSNIQLLEDVKLQLHKLGIFSTINTRKSAKYELGGKIINSNESYRLEIKDVASVRLFYKLIPLNITYKKEHLKRIFELIKNKSAKEHNDISGAKQSKIVQIKNIGIQVVYNLQADSDHTYLAEGIITHNTTQDAILGSSFFSWNIGLANSIGAKKTSTITKDDDIFANIGSSYTGTNYKVDDAVTKSGKKYGLLSRNAYNKANNAIIEARRQQNIMSGISDEATDRRNLRNSMSAFNGIRREYELQGGYNQANIRVGKEGLKFELTFEGELPNLIFSGELPQIFKFGGELPKLQFGGEMPISKYQKFIESLPDNLKPKEGDNYNMKLLWELNGKPESFNDVKGIIFTYDKKDKSWHAPSVAYNENKDEYVFLKSLNHPTYNKELEWYFSPEAAEFRSKYKYDPISNKYLPIIPKSMQMLKKGGEFNVIPDGALHARKHHMDMEGITQKGIPVVDNEGNQTAEIEKEEIIFRLSVTEELEKLNKIYQSSDSKKKEKEEAALEAGKLLVYEILNNTIDNTNLIENAT